MHNTQSKPLIAAKGIIVFSAKPNPDGKPHNEAYSWNYLWESKELKPRYLWVVLSDDVKI